MKVLVLILSYIAIIQCDTFYKDVATFCTNNGLLFLTATSYDGFMINEVSSFFESFKNSRIRLRTMPVQQIESMLAFHFDDLLLISKGPAFSGNFQSELATIQSRKIKKSLLVIPNIVNENDLNEGLQQMQGNAYFYVAYAGSTTTKFLQVISLSNNSRTIVSEIKFNQHGHIIENFNLQVSIDSRQLELFLVTYRHLIHREQQFLATLCHGLHIL